MKASSLQTINTEDCNGRTTAAGGQTDHKGVVQVDRLNSFRWRSHKVVHAVVQIVVVIVERVTSDVLLHLDRSALALLLRLVGVLRVEKVDRRLDVDRVILYGQSLASLWLVSG